MFYLRAGAVVLWFVISFLICFVVSIIRWRHPSGSYVFSYIFSRGAAFLLGITVQVRNESTLQNAQPCVYLGNHQSNLDVFNQAYCYQPRTIAVGKKEVLWIPLFGIIFYSTGNIFIDRSNRQKALKSLEKADEVLTKKRVSIWMFPEGTRNKGAPALLPFKKGAFHMAIHAQAPLVPVVSGPLNRLVDVRERKIIPGTLLIEVLEPIPTKGLTENDVDALVETTYNRMQEAFSRLSNEMDQALKN